MITKYIQCFLHDFLYFRERKDFFVQIKESNQHALPIVCQSVEEFLFVYPIGFAHPAFEQVARHGAFVVTFRGNHHHAIQTIAVKKIGTLDGIYQKRLSVSEEASYVAASGKPFGFGQRMTPRNG